MVRNCADIGEILRKIVQRLLANQNLLKLLYYSDKNPLENPDLSEELKVAECFDKLVRITPRLSPVDTSESKSFISVKVLSGIETDNGEFRNITFTIESFIPMTQWFIKNENLRPFLIMGEVENSLKGKTINGLGAISGGDFSLKFLTEEMTCYEQVFSITTYD